jgi:hypothetical protein
VASAIQSDESVTNDPITTYGRHNGFIIGVTKQLLISDDRRDPFQTGFPRATPLNAQRSGWKKTE